MSRKKSKECWRLIQYRSYYFSTKEKALAFAASCCDFQLTQEIADVDFPVDDVLVDVTLGDMKELMNEKQS